ncbi:MAG: hypothetical protein EU549_01955 [Promethearchaeota archaeon]|nr:MAG: hypothetical protein EU549_01955 [Candidatus Lokiarchaeota archaeon]
MSGKKIKIRNSKDFSNIFGLESLIYKKSIKILKHYVLEDKNNKVYRNSKENWKSYFRYLYNEKDLNLDLFLKHAYLVSLSKIILKVILCKNFREINPFKGGIFSWLDEIKELEELIINKSTHINLDIKEDLLTDLYQDMISSSIRHSIGEFYTPKELAEVMIDDSYNLGDKTLDPACGSGIFLIEIIKKILSSSKLSKKNKSLYINKIFGIDINPISVLITKINLLLLTRNFDESNISNNIFFSNSLDINNDISTRIGKIDLIIGNPPWLVYRDLESNKYQVLMKKIAEKNNIKPGAKDISNLEITTLFFYEIPRIFLKNSGKIFFVMTANVLNGSQSQKFRNFNGFSDIIVWDFQDKLFNIKNIALKARYQKRSEKPYPIELRVLDDRFEIIEKSKLVPAYVEGEKIKKLIRKEDKPNLLPVKKSYYYKHVHKGADLFPRALIFVEFERKNNQIIIANRDLDATARSKKPWKKTYFKNVEIESNYIFKAIKGNLLVPFNINGVYRVVLPIDRNYQRISIENLKPKMKTFYNKINKIYIENKKSTTKFQNLWENINYRNKLIKQDPNLFKVVYNEAGTNLKAAVVGKDIIVDYTLLYYQTPNIDECYYLCAILNSQFLNKNLRIIKSSRHFVKRPFKFEIPKYDPLKKFHIKLKDLAHDCEDLVRKNQNKENITSYIKSRLSEIEKLVRNILQ